MKREDVKAALRELKEMEAEGLLDAGEAREERKRLLNKWHASYEAEGVGSSEVDDETAALLDWAAWAPSGGDSTSGHDMQRDGDAALEESLSRAASAVKKHFEVEREGGLVRISWWWKHLGGSIFLLVLMGGLTAVFGGVCLTFVRALLFDERKPDAGAGGLVIFLLITLVFFVGFVVFGKLAYSALIEVIGHMTIELDEKTLKLASVPLPMFWTPPFFSRTLSTERLEGFFLTEKLYRGKMGHAYRYRLWMREKEGREQLVIGLELGQGEAEFLKATLERHLHAMR